MKNVFKILLLVSLFAAYAAESLADEAPLKSRIKAAILGSDLTAAQRIQHFLNRVAGGSNITDVTYQRFAKMTEGHINAQASAEAMAAEVVANLNELGQDDPGIEAKIRAFYPMNGLSEDELVQQYGAAMAVSAHAASQFRLGIRRDIAGAHLIRSTLDGRGLKNALFDFWFDHFNVDSRKDFLDIFTYTKFIRTNMSGKFSDLLMGVAKHPAMLIYLDNIKSTKQMGNEGPNENYARELMELHTFGVGPTAGVYTQTDIQNVALILTGWNISSLKGWTVARKFNFQNFKHDDSVKVAIGRSYGPAGVAEGEQLIQFLAAHPRTAGNIVNKLVRKLVSEDMLATIDLRAHAKAMFLSSGGNLREVYETILTSPIFWSSVAYNAKYKRPLEFVASALKLTGASRSTLNLATCEEGRATIKRMGQDFFTFGAPTGMADRATDWITSSNVVEAIRYGVAIADYRQESAANRNLFNLWDESVSRLPAQSRFGQTVEAVRAYYDLDHLGPRFNVSPLVSSAEPGTLLRMAAEQPDTVHGDVRPLRSVAGAFIGSKDFLKK